MSRERRGYRIVPLLVELLIGGDLLVVCPLHQHWGCARCIAGRHCLPTPTAQQVLASFDSCNNTVTCSLRIKSKLTCMFIISPLGSSNQHPQRRPPLPEAKSAVLFPPQHLFVPVPIQRRLLGGRQCSNGCSWNGVVPIRFPIPHDPT